MPQAVLGSTLLAAGVTAVAGLGGAKLASSASSKASKLSAAANAEALAFERQKYEEEQSQAKAQWEAQEAQQAPYRAARYSFAKQLASRYGIEMPEMVTPTFPGVGGVTGGGRVGGSVQPAQAMTLSRLAGMAPQQAAPIEPSTPALMPPPIMTLGDFGRRT